MKYFAFVLVGFFTITLNVLSQNDKTNDEYTLVFNEEFNVNGKPDSLSWNYEYGFVRNEEYQWYQEENAYINDGFLIIEGRRETIRNPKFNKESNYWKKNREFAQYTSSSINTRGKKEFLFGRFEIRAKIDTSMGLWPAIWTLGVNKNWPNNGEIDIMESYPIHGTHHILANVLSVDGENSHQKWNSAKFQLNHFLKNDKDWCSKFHIWKMDWDENSIKLYLDDELLNETLLSSTIAPDGFQPFNQPHYILLNLAIGGQNGGDPSKTKFPSQYIIDYVKVYQKMK